MDLKNPSRQERSAQKQRRTYQVDNPKRDAGSNPNESDESVLKEAAPRKKKNRHSQRKTNASPGTRVLLYQSIVSILGWIFGLISTTLNVLKYPFVIFLVVLVVAAGIEYSTKTITSSLCGLPFSSYIFVCKPVPLLQSGLPLKSGLPTLLDSLDYSSKLQELQKFGADNQEMVYALTIGEGEVRKMIFQLSITDAPSRAKLRPLYEGYKQLSGDTIDGLQDWLVQLDQIVKNTIIITSWTQDELMTIQDKKSDFFAPAIDLLCKATGCLTSAAHLEVDVKKTFLDMTEQVSQQVSLALLQAQRVRGYLVEMKATMETFAMIYLEDEKKLKLDKRLLSEESFWRRILGSHSNEMANFEKTIGMCAKFYNLTEYTLEKNRMVEVKMGSIRSQLKAFQDNLSLSPLWLRRDMPLQPYLQMLSDSVRTLEISDKDAKEKKVEAMKRIDEAIRQH